jgi:hypothetical protein
MTDDRVRVRRVLRRWVLVLPLLAVACGVSPDGETLTDRPTLPFSVLVTGGAFLQRTDGGGEPFVDGEREILAPTTFVADEDEATSIETIVEELIRGGVFAATQSARHLDNQTRREIANLSASRQSLAGAPAFELLRREAELAGADLLVVIESVQDRPITSTGVNGQWPVTVTAWITVGLGMFIPDHSFDSQATLQLAIRDPVQGKELHRIPVAPGRVDLSLVQRTDFLGLLTSVIVPPPLVGNDPDKVAAKVREEVRSSLVSGLVRRLKTREVLDRIVRAMPLRVHLAQGARGSRSFLLELQSEQDLAHVRVLQDGEVLEGPQWIDFQERLLRSGRGPRTAGLRSFRAVSPPLAGRNAEIRVQVRTVLGERASQTIRLNLEL